MRIAIDIGGTFTDLVALYPNGKVVVNKSLTTPENQAIGIQNCLSLGDIDVSAAKLFMHGTTVAINTVIERKGQKTALVTTRGFRDVYEIGRGNRTDAFDLFFHRAKPLIPRSLRFEVDERINGQGEIVEALSKESVQRVAEELARQEVKAVAICFLHSYQNDQHEVEVKKLLQQALPGVFITASHEVLREFREYERTSTIALNAYVGPIVSKYLGTLENHLQAEGFRGNLLIMQSNGGAMSVEIAKRTPVTMMESGPVAGVIGAAKIGLDLGYSKVISFDMGGTTAKASLVEGGIPEIVSGYYIGGESSGQPTMVPVVDIVEVGSGGGSIAWIDEVGGLRVGPVSAGADPGPVSFNRGGQNPTVTDANLVLGRIDPKYFMRGQMLLDRELARKAIEEKIAKPLGMDIETAALGILQIADTNMSYSVRAVSVEKGKDPRDYAIIASGGGGPLHSLAIARELHIPRVIIPRMASNLSALGMLLSDLRHDYTQTYVSPFVAMDQESIISHFKAIEVEGRKTLLGEGAKPENIEFIWELDMRYSGQEYSISVPVPAHSWNDAEKADIRAAFDAAHLEQYSHNAPAESVDIVRLHIAAIGRIGESSVTQTEQWGQANPVPEDIRPVCFGPGTKYADCRVFSRAQLPPHFTIDGPVVIEDAGSTIVLSELDKLVVSGHGHIEVLIGNQE
jgi:N-methylhydantoinase A